MPYPSHGVLGTASPPSLEQTLGGLDNTQAWQRVPRTIFEGGVSHPHFRLIRRLGSKFHSKIGMMLYKLVAHV